MNALVTLVTAAPSVVALTKTAAPVALAVAARAHSVPLEAYLLGLAALMLPVGLVLRKREVREEKQYQERMSRYLALEQVADRLKEPKELLAAKAVVGCILAAETGHACLDDDFPTATFSKELFPLFKELRIHWWKDSPREVRMEKYDLAELTVVAQVIHKNLTKCSGLTLTEAALERNSIANLSEQECWEAGLPDLR